MKKLFLIVLVGILVLAVVSCSTESETVQEEAAQEEDVQEEVAQEEDTSSAETTEMKDITISFMASQDWIEDLEMELGEKFTEETGIKIDYQIVPADQYFNLLLTKLNAGEGPDIFGGHSGSDIVTQLNVEENAVPLTDQSWVTEVDPLVLDTLSVDGEVYGQLISDVSSTWAIAYNKQIFDDLGLEVPTTFEEFKEVSAAIQDAGIIPIYESVADGWHHVLWYAIIGAAYEKAQPGLYDQLNANEVSFAGNEDMIKAINQIQELIDLGYWGPNFMSNEYANGPAALADGSHAMFLVNQGIGGQVNEINPDIAPEDIGFFPIPLLDNQIMGINPGGVSRFIYSGGENIDAAKQYFEFMARPENINALIENVARYNTMPYTYATEVYNDTLKEFYSTYAEKGVNLQIAVNYVNPQWMDIGKDLTAIFIGDMTAEEMLQNIDARRAEQAAVMEDQAWEE